MAELGHQIWSREQVCRTLSVSEKQLRKWEQQGLISSRAEYAFSDLVALRTLNDLSAKRIPPRQIRKSFDYIESSGLPLSDLKLSTDGKRILLRLYNQQIEAGSGQFVFNFEVRTAARNTVVFPAREIKPPDARKQKAEADYWFQKGLEIEQSSGSVKDAVEAYESAIGLNPVAAGALVNLGTIYFHKRDWKRSETYYARAVAADPNYALARFNLANLHDERGESKLALEQYHEALRIQPQYADAHYNLALLFQGVGDIMHAVSHWNTYLKLDPTSQWASIARRELSKLKQITVVQGSRPAKRNA